MNKHGLLIILFISGLVVSAIRPHDYFTWLLEVFPAIIGFVVLLLTYKRFRFTYLTYVMILIHSYILFIGGHYTYAEVPAFDWIRDAFDQTRNNYDKVGHFAQGFIPAFIVRELFVRLLVVQKRKWLGFIVVCICISISVIYEFIEWLVAILTGESADSFLGTQGYIWDTQSDMFFATVGAICMIVLFSKIQDRRIGNITTA